MYVTMEFEGHKVPAWSMPELKTTAAQSSNFVKLWSLKRTVSAASVQSSRHIKLITDDHSQHELHENLVRLEL